jgi:flagellar hook-associated protein 2
MAGALSTLGLGSQGVLTNDIIDQLKGADTASIIKPIENKISTNSLKQTALSDIKKLITSLNDQVVALSEPSLYNSKTSSLSGSSVKINAGSKAIEQSFDIDVKNLATRDIQESSTGFGYEEALVGKQTLSINIADNDYVIEISVTDNLKDLTQKIKEQTGGKVEASILNIGGDDPYKLIIKSADTGSNQAITVTSSEDDGLSFNRVGNELPKDAVVEIDGIEVTRSSNHIDDLVSGVEIDLQAEGKTTVKVENNSEKLEEEMEKFASSYNDIVNKITEVTKFDKEKKTAGIFQGTSEIRSITTQLNNVLATAVSDNGKTIADFGLELKRGGTISFNKSDFQKMIKEDPSVVENFFRGTDGANGLFNKFESKIFDLSTSSSGTMKLLKTNLKDTATFLLEEQTKAQTRLDDRYKIMQKKFAAYDGIIGRLSNQAETLSSLIEADLAQKN